MAGLILFFALGVWLSISTLVAWLATKLIKNKWVRYPVMVLVIPILFLLPVWDEIIGQFQFKKLCSNEVIFVDELDGKNRDIYLDDVGDQYINQWPLKFVKQNWIYRDAQTHQILVSWSVIRSKGGWLSRFIGFPEGNPPYIFNGACRPKGSIDFDKLNLHKVQRNSVIGRK